jgi:hypothetical protein
LQKEMNDPNEPTLESLERSRGITNTHKFIMLNHARNLSKLMKEPNTSATGSITKAERQCRNKLKKMSKASKKRNRK